MGMGDERKVKWQILEERERMEKCFQEGFQSDLYTLFKVSGSFFTFLKQKLRINFSRFIFHSAEKTLFFLRRTFRKTAHDGVRTG